jgi:hypothetical protein
MRDSVRVPRGAMRAISQMLAAGTLAAIPACAHHAPQDTGEDFGPAQLTVENQEFPDFDIYVVTEAGMRLRLGLASGHATTTFDIPKTIVDGGAAHLHFIADPVGGQVPEVGEMVVVNPGDEVQLTIAPY